MFGIISNAKRPFMAKATQLFLLVLKFALLMLYLDPEAHPRSVSAFLLVLALDNLLKHYCLRDPSYKERSKAISLIIKTIRGVMLVPLSCYLGMGVMNDYIKRHAETISYEEINIIRAQQLLYWLLVLYSMIRALCSLLTPKDADPVHPKNH